MPFFFLLSLLVSFHLQIAYRKVRNLQISVNKLVQKVSIIFYITQSLLHHENSSTCVISIIIDVPTVAYAMVSRSCIPKQIDLTSVFVTTAALLCQHVIVNKQM